MKRFLTHLAAAISLAIPGIVIGTAAGAATPSGDGSREDRAAWRPTRPTQQDEFTPVIAVSLDASTQPVRGTDGRYHAVYELRLANTRTALATLLRVQVLNAHDRTQVVAAYQGAELLSRLHTLDSRPAENAEIEFDGTRQLLIHLAFDSREQIPREVIHRFDLKIASAAQAPAPLSYSVAPVEFSRQPLIVIGPPLAGRGWVAINGCCEADGVHRNTGLPINGEIYFAQRYAIDWMRMDEQGRLAHGDLSDVRNYTSYGADVIAVADGVVVDALDNLDEQTPPNLPPPESITVQNLLGNHVIMHIGDGVFAFYAHMQKGANGVRVRAGDRVRRGQVLGKLGNSGNTSAPHLHFHLVDGPSAIGSSGIPYVIDQLSHAGQIKEVAELDTSYRSSLFAKPLPRPRTYPLDLNVINFPVGSD